MNECLIVNCHIELEGSAVHLPRKVFADTVNFQKVVSTVKFILPVTHKSVDCNVKSQRKLPSEIFASFPV